MKHEPTFFIIGAPKCGTSSIAAWLDSHPNVYMSPRKEPHFFSTDIPVATAVRSAQEYADLFSGATHEHQVIGEASTSYMRSSVAVPTIRGTIPHAKFIVCLRNPIDMVCSAHMQLLKAGREPERALAVAWEKQAARREGIGVPAGEHPEAFQYGALCRLGEQLERLFLAVPRDRVHVILLDEMGENPGVVYRDLLQFLGVRHDGRSRFPVENARREPKLRSVARIMRRAKLLKHQLGLTPRTGVGGLVQRWNSRPINGKQLPPEIGPTLREYFAPDIRKLELLLGRDLSGWLL